MFDNVLAALNEALHDWGMMQKTEGDEGAEWAEIFERHFYVFIDEFESWLLNLDNQPTTLEKAEKLKEVEKIQDKLPAPLQLNFSMELERIIDGLESTRFD